MFNHSPDNVKTSNCKITCIKNYLQSQNIFLDERELFLLGIDNLLEFGLEKVHHQYLWFLLPYNYQCEKKIIRLLDIPVQKVSVVDVERLKEKIDSGEILSIYFDNAFKKEAKKVFNQVELSIPVEGRMRNSSMGIIKAYTEDAFITDIKDIDGEFISIPFSSFESKLMGNNLLRFGKMKNTPLHSQIMFMIERNINKLIHNHLLLQDKYEKDEDGKYGTQGVACVSAMYHEFKATIDYILRTGSADYCSLLLLKFNVLRVYATKGSPTCYRKQLAESLIYCADYFGLSKETKENLKNEIIASGNQWRDFTRFLFSANYPFFYERLGEFSDKLYYKLEKLYESETRLGKMLQGSFNRM